MEQQKSSGPTAELARFAAELSFEDLPAALVERTRRLVRESLGCILYGVTLPWTRKVLDLAVAEDAKPSASILGTAFRTSAANAALVGATAGHAFELDDIHRGAIVHAGSLTLPVALALAEARGGMTGREFVTALVAGYEVACRVGLGATQKLLLRGFHPQGTTGAFAAAATAARALGLDAMGCRDALGTAGSLAGGLMAAQEGAMVKRLHSGRAAQNGLQAALLAERGFTGISDVLEASYGGFLAAHSDSVDLPALTQGLGSVWETMNVGFKPYASVTSIHTALDALATLMREHGLRADDIARISARVSTPTFVHCAWPYRGQSVTAAQMNLFYGLAVMAIDGDAFVNQYREERISDPVVLDLVGRIEAAVDPSIDAEGPDARHVARITVETRDARILHREERQRRGSPERPLDEAELRRKFRAQADALLPASQVDALENAVQGLEAMPDVRPLAALCRPPGN